MYASTIRKINLGKKPPVLQSTLCIPKSPGWSLYIYLTAMTHLSCKKGGKFIFATLCIGKEKGFASKATRLCTRLQGCFSGGGRWHLLEGNFRAGKGEPAKVGLQAHSLLGETSLSMHPRTKGQPLLLYSFSCARYT